MRKGLILTSIIATLLLGASQAQAGDGASVLSINNAIATGNADVIVSELERAEFLACGSHCIEPVMKLLDSDNYRIREVAAWWFARRPAQRSEVRDMSVARLYGSDTIAARNAADVLGTFRHPDAIQALSYAATRQDLGPEARAAAVKALGTIGHPDGEPAIDAAVADPDASVRIEAAKAYLALRGIRDGAPLLPLLTDSDLGVRRQATQVVGHFAYPQARQTFETLLLNDDDFLVRRNAAWALGQIGDTASRAALETAAQNDASAIVRSVANAALQSLR